MNSVQTTVAAKITALAPLVEDKVVDAIVDREVSKRSDALVKLIDAVDIFERDLKKVKPKQTFDIDGKVISESYDKQTLEERNKLVKKISKYTTAISKALEKSDFGDAYNLSKNGYVEKADTGEDQGSGNSSSD